MILSSYPTIDLHGMDRVYAVLKTKEFINDCYKLKHNKIVIIHGIGKRILLNEVRNYLKKDKKVVEYKTDFMNPGCTIVSLKVDKN